MATLLPPGPMGCISRFIWTFQCLTLVLACRSFCWAAWEGTEGGDGGVNHLSHNPRSWGVGRNFPSLGKPGLGSSLWAGAPAHPSLLLLQLPGPHSPTVDTALDISPVPRQDTLIPPQPQTSLCPYGAQLGTPNSTSSGPRATGVMWGQLGGPWGS